MDKQYEKELEAKIADDSDFLSGWKSGSIRSKIPSKAYKDNYDRIFRNRSSADCSDPLKGVAA